VASDQDKARAAREILLLVAAEIVRASARDAGVSEGNASGDAG